MYSNLFTIVLRLMCIQGELRLTRGDITSHPIDIVSGQNHTRDVRDKLLKLNLD